MQPFRCSAIHFCGRDYLKSLLSVGSKCKLELFIKSHHVAFYRCNSRVRSPDQRRTVSQVRVSCRLEVVRGAADLGWAKSGIRAHDKILTLSHASFWHNILGTCIYDSFPRENSDFSCDPPCMVMVFSEQKFFASQIADSLWATQNVICKHVTGRLTLNIPH